MATTNFYLKPEDKKGFSQVMLVYQDKGKKFKISTKLKVRKNNWEKGKLIKGKSSEVKEVNSILERAKGDIQEILREAMFNKREYSVDVVERKFRMKIGELSAGNEFFRVYQEFTENAKATKSHSTIVTYNSTLKRLKDYAAYCGEPITFEKMNQSFYDGFMNYLIKVHNSLNNTLGKHIKTLKVFLNYCIQNEIIPSNINLKGFKVLREETDIIYLTEEELFKVLNLEGLPKCLEQVKDNFCFACFTGLRFSDMAKINRTNIKEDFIEIKTEKTRESLKIPLNQHARNLLKKYGSENEERPLPPTISNQKTNEYLKELCEIAEIDELIEIEKFSGSKKIIIKKPKYNFVTTHTARRTFVTLSLEKGIRAEVVMDITGHKKYQTFKRYIKITDTVKLLEMAKVWDRPNLKAV